MNFLSIKVREMRKMTVKRRCAMILVMSSDYRDSCMPYPQEIIDKTHHKLPIIANKRNEDLLTIIKVIFKKFLRKNKKSSICREGTIKYDLSLK